VDHSLASLMRLRPMGRPLDERKTSMPRKGCARGPAAG
jgi:hypothetical protein